MSISPSYCCTDMAQAVQDASLIHYSEVFDEYGIIFQEDNVSILQIHYCPWCGHKLPDSKREQWFDELESLGYDSPLSQEHIPERYKSAAWRVKDAAPYESR